jgi:hypothetical protein
VAIDCEITGQYHLIHDDFGGLRPSGSGAAQPHPRIRHYTMAAPTFSMGDNAINPWMYNAGFDPIGVDLSELFKGGGSVKCCTMEVHS